MAMSHLFTALGYLRKQEEHVLRGLAGQTIQQIADPSLQIGMMHQIPSTSFLTRNSQGRVVEVPFSYSEK